MKREIQNIPFFHSFDPLVGRLILRWATYIPDEVFQFAKEIKILDITGGSVSELPPDFLSLDNLFTVFFWENNFREFPQILSQCKNLKIISFKNGILENITEDAFPESLEWLVLTNNPHLQKIPHSIGKLRSLRKLALTGTRISTLPESLKECIHLEFLRLSACQFTTDFPEWIQDFPKLAWFAGAGNPNSIISTEVSSTYEFDLSDIVIDEKINESQSSVVSLAHLRSTSQSIVVKVFKDLITSDGFPMDDIRASFALGQHPNIVHMLGKVRWGDTPTLVSVPIPETYTKLWLPPTLESCTRATYPPDATFSIDFIIRVLRDIASAGAHIHARGISHGDLYAHNILVDPSGNAILCDFWAATFYDSRLHPEYEMYDVRAFGYLTEELLDRVDKIYQSDNRIVRLRGIHERCNCIYWWVQFMLRDIERLLTREEFR